MGTLGLTTVGRGNGGDPGVVLDCGCGDGEEVGVTVDGGVGVVATLNIVANCLIAAICVNTTLSQLIIERLTNVVSNLMSLLLYCILLLYINALSILLVHVVPTSILLACSLPYLVPRSGRLYLVRYFPMVGLMVSPSF